MDEILDDFRSESKGLVDELMDILDEVEGEYDRRGDLEKYGQVVDRIMGGAKSLEMAVDVGESNLPKIGMYAELCKIVGYKASQIEGNEQFFDAVVAVLLDATEMLEQMVNNLGSEGEKNIKDLLSNTFLDRLKWISGHFDANMRSSIAVDAGQTSEEKATEKTGDKTTDKPAQASNSQAEINELLKALGVN